MIMAKLHTCHYSNPVTRFFRYKKSYCKFTTQMDLNAFHLPLLCLLDLNILF
jgi:hypothetical protein